MTQGYALVTPSFRGDFERCRLLVESVVRHVPESVAHYLVVDRRDVAMFEVLQSPRTRLLVVEDLLPWWVVRLPGVRRFWWSFRSFPIRNWMLQQIVKLSVSQGVREEHLFYVDSDVFFVRAFDPSTLTRDGRAPLFCETGKSDFGSFNDEWHRIAARLIGIRVEEHYDTIFVGNIISWRRSVVKDLIERVQQVSGEHWVLALARTPKMSEYVLYGLYASRLLPESESLHYRDSTNRTLCYWDTKPLSRSELSGLKATLADEHVAVMLSAKSRTEMQAIREVFSYPE